ncbi:MAG TPA: hypothetical protein VD962_13095 [Rubricoccaceae bacterium]|nr:hypothetical protein [Rubricoccaceae bacterium]
MVEYLPAIAAAFFGFVALAFLLLFPVHRFLRREERAAEDWTKEAIARRQRREEPAGDGRPGEPPPDQSTKR